MRSRKIVQIGEVNVMELGEILGNIHSKVAVRKLRGASGRFLLIFFLWNNTENFAIFYFTILFLVQWLHLERVFML